MPSENRNTLHPNVWYKNSLLCISFVDDDAYVYSFETVFIIQHPTGVQGMPSTCLPTSAPERTETWKEKAACQRPMAWVRTQTGLLHEWHIFHLDTLLPLAAVPFQVIT